MSGRRARSERRRPTQAEINENLAAVMVALGGTERRNAKDPITNAWRDRVNGVWTLGLVRTCPHLAGTPMGAYAAVIYMGEPENALCMDCFLAKYLHGPLGNRCDGCLTEQPPGSHFTETACTASNVMVVGHICDACRVVAGLDPA